MLNLKVHGGTEKDKTVTLRLEKTGNSVIFSAVDENGHRGELLTITASGKIYRLCLVPRELGFQLDDYRRVIIQNGNNR